MMAQIFEVNSIAALNIEVYYHNSNTKWYVSVYCALMCSVRTVCFRPSSLQIVKFRLQSHPPMYLLMTLSAKCIGCNVIRSLSLSFSVFLSLSHSRSCHSGVWLRTLLSLVTDKQGA